MFNIVYTCYDYRMRKCGIALNKHPRYNLITDLSSHGPENSVTKIAVCESIK